MLSKGKKILIADDEPEVHTDETDFNFGENVNGPAVTDSTPY